MEDSEVLLKTDPLAKYIQNLNIPFELGETEYKYKSTNTSAANETSNHDYHIYQDYRACIMLSALLFSDDNALILAYSNSEESVNHSRLDYISWFIIPVSGISIFFSKSVILKICLGSYCLAKGFCEGYKITFKLKTMKIISKLVNTLKNFTELMKKCLYTLIQYMTSINYYSSNSNKLSLGRKLSAFTQMYCSVLQEVVKVLRERAVDFLLLVPLTLDILQIELIEVTENIKLKDIKIFYEYYLLVQSHFLKVLSLIFTPCLWSNQRNNISKVFPQIKTITSIICDKIRTLTKEYNAVQNISNFVQSKVETKRPNLVVSGLHDNLHLAGVHLHQLYSKVRDAQELIQNTNLTSDLTILYKDLEGLVKELDKQIDSPKHYLNAASIILQRTLKSDVTQELTTPDINNEMLEKRAPALPEEESPRGSEVYELFIPKEGLPLDEFISDDKFLPSRNLQYSTTLLEELRQLLKERNPDVVEEEERLKEAARSETPPAKNEVFRPQKPVGFIVNDTLLNILTARQQMQMEDEFGDD